MKKKLILPLLCGCLCLSSTTTYAEDNFFDILASSDNIEEALKSMDDKTLNKLANMLIDELNSRKNNQDNSDIWTIKYYVDEFGAETDHEYLTFNELISGTFSNTATTNSDLLVSFLIDKTDDTIAIKLFEYGTNCVKSSFTDYNIVMKDSSGEKINFPGKIFNNGDRIFVGGDFTILLDAFRTGEDIDFYIEESDHPTTNYLFTVPGDPDFEKKLDLLKE